MLNLGKHRTMVSAVYSFSSSYQCLVRSCLEKIMKLSILRNVSISQTESKLSKLQNSQFQDQKDLWRQKNK